MQISDFFVQSHHIPMVRNHDFHRSPRFRLESSRRCSTFGPKDLRNSSRPGGHWTNSTRAGGSETQKPGNGLKTSLEMNENCDLTRHTPIFVWNVHDIWHDALNNKKSGGSLNSQRGNWGSWKMHDFITVLPLLILRDNSVDGKKPGLLGIYKTLWKMGSSGYWLV